MLTHLPKRQTGLTVSPQNVQVVVAEEGSNPLALVLPPIEDLAEIDALKHSHISVLEISTQHVERREQAFGEQLENQKRKLERFAASPTFLNRLANLAAAAGDRDQEAHFLELARAVGDDSFFAHRIGDNLVARGRDEDAEALFSSLDLGNDVQANLKLAMFHLRRENFDLAEERIRKALEIDPISFAARLFSGGLALARREYDRAIHAFRIAAAERPTSSALHSNMAIAYVGLDMYDKALSSLKRAVALDPLNANIVILLADLTNKLKLHEEAIPSLRYFLQFEQKRPGIWSRLARACLEIGKFDEAIEALRRQASLGDNSSIWNNLGVAYARKKDSSRALRAFKYAMELDKPNMSRTYFLAARNIAQAFADQSRVEEVLRFTRSTIAADKDDICRTDDWLWDIYAFHMHALRASGETDEFRKTAMSILVHGDTAQPLKGWVVAGLLAYLALYEEKSGNALRLFSECKNWIDNFASHDVSRRAVLYNNVAFAFAEAGKLDEAERYLARISDRVHKDAYPTATLGLLNIRRGNLEKGMERYEEAIHLANRQEDKVRLRQKLNLELARFWSATEPSKARRLFEKVIAATDGEKALLRQAKQELHALPAPKQKPI